MSLGIYRYPFYSFAFFSSLFIVINNERNVQYPLPSERPHVSVLHCPPGCGSAIKVNSVIDSESTERDGISHFFVLFIV